MRTMLFSASVSAKKTFSFRTCNLELQPSRKSRENDMHKSSQHSLAVTADKSGHKKAHGEIGAKRQIEGGTSAQTVEGVDAGRQEQAQGDTSVQALLGVNAKKCTQSQVETPIQAVDRVHAKKWSQIHVDTPVLVVNGVGDKVATALDLVNVIEDGKECLDGKEAQERTSNAHKDSERSPVKHQRHVCTIQNTKAEESVRCKDSAEKVAVLPANSTPDLENDLSATNASRMIDKGPHHACTDLINAIPGSKDTDSDKNMSERKHVAIPDELRNSQSVLQFARRNNEEAIHTLRSPFSGSTSFGSSRDLKSAPIAKPAVNYSSTASVPSYKKYLRIDSSSTRSPSAPLPACSGHPIVLRPWTESLLCNVTPITLINTGKGQEKSKPHVLEGNLSRDYSASELCGGNAPGDDAIHSKHVQTEGMTPTGEGRTTLKKRPYSIMSPRAIRGDIPWNGRRELADAEAGVCKGNEADNKKNQKSGKPKRTLTKEAKRRRNTRNRKREKRKRLQAKKVSALAALDDQQVSQDVCENNQKNTLQLKSPLPSILTSEKRESPPSSSCRGNKSDCENKSPQKSSKNSFKTAPANVTTSTSTDGNPGVASQETPGTGPVAPQALDGNVKPDSLDKRNSQSLSSSNDLTGKHSVRLGPKKNIFKGKPRPYAMALGSVAAALTRARSEGVLCGDAENAGEKVQNVPGYDLVNVSIGAKQSTMKRITKPLSRRRRASKKANFYLQEEQHNESLFVGWESATEEPLPSHGLLDIVCSCPDTDLVRDGKNALNPEDILHKSNGCGGNSKSTPFPALEKFSSASKPDSSKGSNDSETKSTGGHNNGNIDQAPESKVHEDQGAPRTQKNSNANDCALHDKDSLTTELRHDNDKMINLANPKAENGCSSITNGPLSAPTLKHRPKKLFLKPNTSDDIREILPVNQQSGTQSPLVGTMAKDIEGTMAQTEVLSPEKKLTQGMGVTNMSAVESLGNQIMMDSPPSPKQTSRREVNHLDFPSLENDSWKSDISRLLHHEPCHDRSLSPPISFSLQPQDIGLNPLQENAKKSMKQHYPQPNIHQNKSGASTNVKRKENENSAAEENGSNRIPWQHSPPEAECGDQLEGGTPSLPQRLSTIQSVPRTIKTARKESCNSRDTPSENATSSSFSELHESVRPASQERCDPSSIKKSPLQRTAKPNIDSRPRSPLHKPTKDLSSNTPQHYLPKAFNLFGMYSEASSEKVSPCTTSLNGHDNNQTDLRQQHDESTLQPTFHVPQETITHRDTKIDEHECLAPLTYGASDKSLPLLQRAGACPRQPADFRSMMIQVLSEANTVLEQFHARR